MPLDEIISILRAEEGSAKETVANEFQPKIDHTIKVIAVIRKVLNEQKSNMRVDDVLKAVVTFYLAKAVRTTRAIIELCKCGWGVESLILLRSLVESMITMYYIVDGGIDRAELYVKYDFILQKQMLDRALKDEEVFQIIGYTDEQRQEILSNYEEVKGNYPRKYQWAGITIGKMAEEVGLTFFYDYVYWMFSNVAHSNPRSSLHYLEIVNDKPKFKFGPSHEWISPCLALCSEILIRILSKLREVFPIQLDDDVIFLEGLHRSTFGPDEFAGAKD